MMKTLLQLEEVGLLLLAVWLFGLLPYPWWCFLVWFFAPDLSMMGYLAGRKFGAYAYNLFHHRGFSVLVYLGGVYLAHDGTQLAGIILLAHATFDRIFGYGLKFQSGFKDTHLGTIGRK